MNRFDYRAHGHHEVPGMTCADHGNCRVGLTAQTVQRPIQRSGVDIPAQTIESSSEQADRPYVGLTLASTHPIGIKGQADLADYLSSPENRAKVESIIGGYRPLLMMAAEKAIRHSLFAGGLDKWPTLGINLDLGAFIHTVAESMLTFVQYDCYRTLIGSRKTNIADVRFDSPAKAIQSLVTWAKTQLIPAEIEALLPLSETERICTQEVRNQIRAGKLTGAVQAAHQDLGRWQSKTDKVRSAEKITSFLGTRDTRGDWKNPVKELTTFSNIRIARNKEVHRRSLTAKGE